MYNNVNINIKDLKSKVMKNAKNGHDVITNLSIYVPKLIFNQLKK